MVRKTRPKQEDAPREDARNLNLTPRLQTAEGGDEAQLRPATLAEFIGQKQIKENLQVYIEAAKQRKDSLDHVFFSGPPGLGKTTLSYIISRELGVHFRGTSGPAIERPGDMVSILSKLNDRDVLFIDEIHRLSPTVEEVLYPAMEDFRVDLVIGQGPTARTLQFPLKPFTLIGATTRVGLLSPPLRDRFGVINRLESYTQDELMEIVLRASRILAIPIEPEGARELAKRSRGTPRIANRLLRRVRDFAQVKADGIVTLSLACSALDRLEIDGCGFDAMDRQFLNMLVHKFGGGPVGVGTLAAAMSEERDTLEDVCEPFLLQNGYLERTPRGRQATPLAYRYLGLPVPTRIPPPESGSPRIKQEPLW